MQMAMAMDVLVETWSCMRGPSCSIYVKAYSICCEASVAYPHDIAERSTANGQAVLPSDVMVGGCNDARHARV